jgi:site-specific DNA-methyltransferase (adenine-specific)
LSLINGIWRYPDNYFNIGVVDPPYGIGEDGRKKRATNGIRKIKQKNGSILRARGDYDAIGWDNEIPPQEYFDELFRVTKHQIIFGINNFIGKRDLPIGPGRIFWDKVNGDNDFSDGELAYCSMHSSIRIVKYMWNGMMQGKSIREGYIQQGNKRKNEKRIHPTQKPKILYRWIAHKYIKPGWKVLDTHVGSASSLIVYEENDIEYVGYEKEAKYYTDGTKRMKQELSQLRLKLI